MWAFYTLNRAEFLQHYHKRSNVETTFHMIKSKFGQRLRSRTLTAEVNEALCRNRPRWAGGYISREGPD